MEKIQYNPTMMSREEYIGTIRYNLFVNCNLDATSIVVEVAPWCLPKVWLWLKRINFSWTLYVVEPDALSLESIIQQYKQMMPFAKIIWLQYELAEAQKHLPSKIEVLCSNHPLDDMVISYANYAVTTQEYYRWCYGHPDLSISVWNKINADDVKLSKVIKDVVQDWIDIVNTFKPRYTFISQYKSYYYQKNNILIPDLIAHRTLLWLVDLLGKDNSQDSILEQYSQNPDEWLIIKR